MISFPIPELHNLAGGLDNFSNSGHHHLPPMNHFNDFASNGYGRPQQPHTNHHGHHPFVTSPTENHLGPQLRHQQQQQQQSHHQTSKDWQEGLRALLPNVNVSFGALPNQSDGLHTPPANGRMFSSPPLNDHHHHNHHDRLPQRQHSGKLNRPDVLLLLTTEKDKFSNTSTCLLLYVTCIAICQID